MFTPVFYGYRDHDLSLPAPQIVTTSGVATAVATRPPIAGSIAAKCRVFYPSLDGSPSNAPPLSGCATTPLIVFSHGQCNPGNVPDDFYLAWYEIPAMLARAGYVVLVPQYAQSGRQSDDDLERLVRLITWARSDSPYADMLKASPSTGLVGHSFGAGLSARAITESGVEVKALALLSPQETILGQTSIPLLHAWGDGFDVVTDPKIDTWVPTGPAHAVQFTNAAHHDYIRFGRADCATNQQNDVTLMPFIAADIVALFMGRYLPQDRMQRGGCLVPLSSPKVPISLEPAAWSRTTEQQFYAGGWHSAWPLLDTGNYDPVEIHYWSGGEWHTNIRVA